MIIYVGDNWTYYYDLLMLIKTSDLGASQSMLLADSGMRHTCIPLKPKFSTICQFGYNGQGANGVSLHHKLTHYLVHMLILKMYTPDLLSTIHLSLFVEIECSTWKRRSES